jgi:hypothetical protein
MIKGSSLFSQLLHHFPRTEFAHLVIKHGAERRAKGFTCWTQLVSMLFCHMAHADSLREICGGLACCIGKLRHLGITKAPNKSTLSYANKNRPAMLYEDLFWTMLNRFRQNGRFGNRKSKFRFKNKLLSLDSTTISLCLNLFPWAEFRRAKGGIKVHVLLDHDDYMPSYALITEAKRHDRTVARRFSLKPGSIVAFDRAYNDYTLFSQWTTNNIYFVTRQKENAVYEIVENRKPPKFRSILSDQIIRLTGHKAEEKCPHLLRRIVVWDKINEREIVLLTNHLRFGASTIAAIYKDRWEIGVSSKGHITQSVKVRPRSKDSHLVAWEAPWRETKAVEPSDIIFNKENMQHSRPQRTVNVDVASLHANLVAETVYNARRQQGLTETGLMRQLSPAGYQRWHGVKGYVETGEALDTRRRNLAEEANPITLNGKWMSRCQGGGLGRSTVDRRAAKRAGREGPRPMSISFAQSEAGVG